MIEFQCVQQTIDDQVRIHKEKMKPGRLYVVMIKELRAPRSTGPHSQNAHVNGHVQQIAHELGAGFDDVKAYIKREAVSMGYPYVTLSNGDILPISEADSDTLQCSYLIEAAHVVAAQEGIILREE